MNPWLSSHITDVSVRSDVLQHLKADRRGGEQALGGFYWLVNLVQKSIFLCLSVQTVWSLSILSCLEPTLSFQHRERNNDLIAEGPQSSERCLILNVLTCDQLSPFMCSAYHGLKTWQLLLSMTAEKPVRSRCSVCKYHITLIWQKKVTIRAMQPKCIPANKEENPF